MIRLFYEVISDSKVREVVKSLVDSLNQKVWLRGQWQFKEVDISGSVTNHPIAHSLGFKPKDIVLLHNGSPVTVTFEYEDFDKNHVYVTTNGSTKLRFFVGQYQEG